MEIKPDKKLITKSWMTLFTISLFIILFSLILTIIPMLDSDVDFSIFFKYLALITLGLILLMFLITVPIMLLWIKNLTFVIEDDKIVIHKGILTKIKQNIPFRMITDFMLERSLFDRWLGIGSIKIQTAGQSTNGSGYEGKLSGLLNWDELHEKLRENLKDRKLEVNKNKIDILDDFQSKILTELVKIRTLLEKIK